MTTKDRTLRFVAYKGLSIKKFEEMCGLSNGYLNSMKSGYGNAKLMQVLAAFPELNRDWLVYGEGEMIRDLDDNSIKETTALTQPTPVCEVIPAQEGSLVAELRAQIERLESKIDNLNQELGEKNALIKMMRKAEMESI